jgi:hypothetical protein
MIEVIYNIDLPALGQYVSLVELKNFPASNNKNRGTLNTGAGSTFLMMAYREFDSVYTYAMCGYMSHFELPNDYDISSYLEERDGEITGFCVPNQLKY